jgi:hypothetical protein
MPRSKEKKPIAATTMRDFRAAPSKVLRKAARTGAKLRLGEFLLEVRDVAGEPPAAELYGAMSATGRLVGPASGLLSANDVWSTDSE